MVTRTMAYDSLPALIAKGGCIPCEAISPSPHQKGLKDQQRTVVPC